MDIGSVMDVHRSGHPSNTSDPEVVKTVKEIFTQSSRNSFYTQQWKMAYFSLWTNCAYAVYMVCLEATLLSSTLLKTMVSMTLNTMEFC